MSRYWSLSTDRIILKKMRDFRLVPRCSLFLCSSGMLRSFGWLLSADVAGYRHLSEGSSGPRLGTAWPLKTGPIVSSETSVRNFHYTLRRICVFLNFLSTHGAGIAQSVWRLATGWTARGSHPGGGWDFPHPSRPALGHNKPPIRLGTGSFLWVKRQGHGVDHPPPSSAEVEGRV